MKLTFPLLCFAALGLGAGLFGCSEHKGSAPDASAEKPPESRVTRGTNGEVTIRLDAETRKLTGLQVEAVAPANLKPESRVYGRVLDPSPLAGLLSELSTAQLALDNSQQEFERTKTLRQQDNASQRALQAAEVAYLRDSLAVRAILVRIAAAWGRKAGESLAASSGTRSNLGNELSNRLVAREALLVRVEVPPGVMLEPEPREARLLPLAPGAIPVAAKFLDFAPSIDPQTQARGLLYLVENTALQLTPGMSLTAFVPTGAPARAGAIVPRAAVVRAGGLAWVYRQTSPEEFSRKEISLDQPLESGWFVSSGVAPGDQVVIVGAQQLLSEEFKGQAE